MIFLPLPWPLKETFSELQFNKSSMFILGRGKDKDKQEEGKGRTTEKEDRGKKERKAIQLTPINILWEKEVFLYDKYLSNLLPALQELTGQLKYSVTQLILEQNMTEYKANVSAMEPEKERQR